MSFAVSTEESPKAKIPKILIAQASPLLETVTLLSTEADIVSFQEEKKSQPVTPLLVLPPQDDNKNNIEINNDNFFMIYFMLLPF